MDMDRAAIESHTITLSEDAPEEPPAPVPRAAPADDGNDDFQTPPRPLSRSRKGSTSHVTVQIPPEAAEAADGNFYSDVRVDEGVDAPRTPLDPPIPKPYAESPNESRLLTGGLEEQYNFLSERDRELELFRLDVQEEASIIGRSRRDLEAPPKPSASRGFLTHAFGRKPEQQDWSNRGHRPSPSRTAEQPPPGQEPPPASLSPTSGGGIESPAEAVAPKLLGTVAGVFLPCLQNILGVIFFIRLSWLVGQAGILQALCIVLMCCACTFITSLSLSAIATNGKVKGGGPYFLIGRALGPEVGVSIGICFYLGTSVAASMYILGAVETLFDAIPSMKIFTGAQDDAIAIADFQVYGTMVTLFLTGIVMLGTKNVSRVGPLFLVPVLLSVLLIYVGMFTASGSDVPGVTGLESSTFKSNWGSAYVLTDRTGKPDETGGSTWNFQALVALFFPSVTGIMAGSNRSGMLRDAQRSIPKGTLAAQGTTSAIYIAAVFMFGAVATRETLLTERLLATRVAFPIEEIASVGIILSTLGAGLQSLSGAPKLLQAMANDDIMPFLRPLQAPEGKDGRKCMAVTAIITAGCVLIGNLDVITPVITMFFLMCYAGVNFSCFLLDVMSAPNWRPRWHFYHWTLALLGATLCLAIMFLISWIFSVVAIALATLIYYYVSLYGKEENWGDGLKSLRYSVALRAMIKLGEKQIHPKNWHPSPLILCKPWGLLPETVPCHPKLLQFASYFQEKGTGMCIVAGIMEGKYAERANAAYVAKKRLVQHINDEKCEAFAEVIVSSTVAKGFRGLVQSAGLGNLRPNMVVVRWPERWRETERGKRTIPVQFVSMAQDCYVAGKALVIVKGIDNFPDKRERETGTIDLYWVVRDGGIMLLLATLLRRKSCWEGCSLRVFCLAEDHEHLEPLRSDVEKFLYDLRMNARVQVLLFRDGERCPCCGEVNRDSAEKFATARRRIAERWSAMDTLKSHLVEHPAAMEAGWDEEENGPVVASVGNGLAAGGHASGGASMGRLKSLRDLRSLMSHKKTEYRMGSGADTPNGTEGTPLMLDEVEREHQERIDKFLSTSVKLNGTIRTHSKDASLVLLSMPPPPKDEHAYNYMEYLEVLLADLPRTLVVRGYRRDVVTLYT